MIRYFSSSFYGKIFYLTISTFLEKGFLWFNKEISKQLEIIIYQKLLFENKAARDVVSFDIINH